MIVPTCVTKNDLGQTIVLNLSQFVELLEYSDGDIDVSFSDGTVKRFEGEDAKQVRGSILYVHNTYQENAKAYEKAKAASSIVPVNGRIIQ